MPVLVISVLIFSGIVFTLSYVIAHQQVDSGLLAMWIVLIAWGSMVFGYFLSTIPL